MRTLAAEIAEKEGKEVELMGWVDVRRDHGKLIFIDLRDRSGIAQVVFIPKDKELHAKAETLRSEWVVRVKGKVGKRPAGMENPKIPSGYYEVPAESLEIISEAKTPPFDVTSEGHDINEETRMKYRYLDLRRPRMKRNLVMRAKTNEFIREFLSKREFIEVETPYISKSTPEGARDYLVPSRVYPGKFYALPQSPQQYKQLLMVAGLEQYFQIVRCFRDEDTRGDRQPEFTQLDIEKSFTDQEEILNLIEELFTALIKKLYPEKKVQKTPFPRMSYKEVMEKYGSDKPDLRKDKNDPDELAFLFVVDFPMFERKDDGSLGAVHHPFTKIQGDSSSKPGEAKELILMLLGRIKKGEWSEQVSLMAHQYDLVLNGFEIAGGSIREHDPEVLQAVFEALGHSTKEVKDRFGHILEAFSYGVPPHGGIAAGLDRFVALLQNEPNIREVIAFPKTGDGKDLMMDGPSEVSKEQLKELHLKVEKEK